MPMAPGAQAASIARRLKRRADEVAAMNRRATELRKRFDRAFWDEALGTYVLALDGDKRPCRVRTSNAGHALLTGIALPTRAARVVQGLMLPSSFSGWGIRTVAATEARYNPMSYHNGSVWPHDNALIAAGMARYGFREQAAQIFKGLFEASTYIDLKRLPELFCGFPRLRSHGPTFYPVACAPQAWAAAATALAAALLPRHQLRSRGRLRGLRPAGAAGFRRRRDPSPANARRMAASTCSSRGRTPRWRSASSPAAAVSGRYPAADPASSDLPPPSQCGLGSGRAEARADPCGSAWNVDPLSGGIGVQD